VLGGHENNDRGVEPHPVRCEVIFAIGDRGGRKLTQ
jgi:hypothetical protein